MASASSCASTLSKPLVELADFGAGFEEDEAQRRGQAATRRLRSRRASAGRHRRAPSGIGRPCSRSSPRIVLRRAVRVPIQAERRRCSAVSVCCAGVLTGTGRISSLRNASSSALASARSVLLRGAVAAYVLRRQQHGAVAELLDLPRPEARRAAGLEQHGRRGLLREERQHLAALQAVPGRDLARAVGNSHFENGLRDVDGDGGSLFHGLLLYGSRPVNPDDFGSQMPIKSGEESISSLERTRWARRGPLRGSPIVARRSAPDPLDGARTVPILFE